MFAREDRPPLFASASVYIIGALFVAFTAWASFAEVDEVARGDGKVIPASKTQIIQATEAGVVQEIAVKIQACAFETLPYIPNIPTGQWSPVTAYRKNLTGVIIAPALFMWNVENI